MNTKPDSRGMGFDAERAVFHRVLCGVDDSPEGLEAVRQADALQGERGELIAISVLDLAVTVHAGWTATTAPSGLRADAELALSAAQSEAPGATCRLVEGRPDQVLLAEARRAGATLLAVGTHGSHVQSASRSGVSPRSFSTKRLAPSSWLDGGLTETHFLARSS